MNAIGIDIGGTQIKAVVADAYGQILRREMRPTGDDSSDAKNFAHRVRELVQELGPDLPVGISAPGLPHPSGQSIGSMPGRLHGLQRLDWQEWLGRKYRVPVLNDAQAALYGEAWVGAAVTLCDAFMLTLGTGVGGAILIKRELLRGAMGRAGHFGHACLDLHSSEKSIVGMPGALECFVGNSNVRARTQGRFETTLQLIDAYKAGDSEAAGFWLESIRALACGIASFINIFDPEAVIVGGGIAQAGDALFKPLEEALKEIEWRPYQRKRGVPIVPAALGEWAGAIGAAREAFDEFNVFAPRRRILELFETIQRLSGARHDAEMAMSTLHSLLRDNTQLDEKDEEGYTAYMMAVRGELPEAAQLLKEAGASTAGHWEAELTAATWGGEAARMEVALKNGADPNTPYTSNFSCVSYCATNGYDEALEMLIRYGAKVGSYDLFHVCTWETADWKIDSKEDEKLYARIVQLLIDHGADPNIRNEDGKTPLEAIADDHLPIIKQVLLDAMNRSPAPPSEARIALDEGAK